MRKHRLRKVLLILAGVIIAFVLIVILFFSPIVKYLVHKYDEKYTGRQITVDRVYANPFTGYVSLKDFKIYEYQSDSVFISSSELNLNFAMAKMLSGTYEISNLTLEEPAFVISQNKGKSNYDDLIEKFNPKDKDTTGDPLHFNVLNITIKEGKFAYREGNIPVDYSLKKIEIESGGKFWDVDTIVTKFSFTSGNEQGSFKGNITFNANTLDFRLNALVKKFDLQIIEQYMQDLANYGSFRATMDADVKARGNFKNKEDLNATGIVAINDFHFGKNPNEDYASFKKLVVDCIELSPAGHKYLFDSISLDQPYFKFEQYDQLNNISAIFGEKGANVKAVNADEEKFNLVIEIAKYVKEISRNFFQSDYKISRLAVYNGDLRYQDYSQSEKFSVALDPFFILADSINKSKNRVKASLRSGIKPYGHTAITLSIDPKDSSYFDLNYNFKKMSAAMLNPYIVSYTSFPLDRGTIELNGEWHVRNGNIKSENHLLVIDPRISDRQKNKDNNWLPLRVFMFFLRERGNVIDYSVPITGNLKDPNFDLRDVILDVIKNIFVKPASVLYTTEVRVVENEVEKSFQVKWEFRKNELQSPQERFVKKIADFLKENPETSIDVYPNHYEEKEKELILLYEAKKKYYLSLHGKTRSSYTQDDSAAVSRMSAKDSAFVRFLDKNVGKERLFTVQEKCARLIGASAVNKVYDRLEKARASSFLQYFKETGTEGRVKVHPGKKKVPYNGFTYYDIKYKGDLPEELVDAYQRINELNNSAPRDKYKLKRGKTPKE